MSSVLMNQRYISNKVSWNRNHVMHWSVDENVVSGALQEPGPIIPLKAIVQYLLIQCLRWLWRTWLPWSMKINCTNISHSSRRIQSHCPLDPAHFLQHENVRPWKGNVSEAWAREWETTSQQANHSCLHVTLMRNNCCLKLLLLQSYLI